MIIPRYATLPHAISELYWLAAAAGWLQLVGWLAGWLAGSAVLLVSLALLLALRVLLAA